ncbi:MAG: ABC transporter permease [Verrucomicrobia bacterium]|nr:ABC transporter permease [Verrucomicrobiota bacterium]
MSWITKLRNLFAKRRYEAEMAEELRAHLDLRAEQLRAAGHSAAEAERLARREFGGVEQIKERCRDGRALAGLEHFGRDLRHAARQLARSPGFTLVAICSLALAIGASTAIFTLVNDFLLRSLPVREPEQLVLFRHYAGVRGGTMARWEEGNSAIDAASGRRTGTSFPVAVFERFRAQRPGLTEVFAFAPLYSANVLIDGQPELQAMVQLVSGNYHRGLGVGTVLGRPLSESDDQPGVGPVAVLSHRCWRTRFGADPRVVGRTFQLNRTSVTIVGVTPPGFDGAMQVGESADFTLPLAHVRQLDQEEGENRAEPWCWWLRVMGRLAPDAGRGQVRAGLEPAFQQIALEGWKAAQALEKSPEQQAPDLPTLGLDPGGQGESDTRREFAPALHLLLGFVGLVLLAACANVANLLLARGAARRGEIAVRLALGAARTRLVRQLLTESLLLATLASALGILLAWSGRGLLLALQPFGQTPLQLDLPLDARVLGFTIALTFATALLFGLAPALRATRLDLTSEFHGTRSLGSQPLTRLSRALLIVQVALSLVLLVGTGLILRSLWNLRGVEPGFRTEGLVFFKIDGAAAGYEKAQAPALKERLTRRLRQIPGVEAVSHSRIGVLAHSAWRGSIHVPGYIAPPGAPKYVFFHHAAPDYFDVLGLPLVLGRSFTGAEAPGDAIKTVIINQKLARQYFGEANPLGRQIVLGEADRPDAQRAEIVGVVRDAKYTSLRDEAPATIYHSSAQFVSASAAFVVRVRGEASHQLAAIRAAVREVEPTLPVQDLRTLDEAIERLHAQETLFARLLGFFGVVAVLLACVGLHGLMSFAVARRTPEFGLRLTLGATRANIMGLIVRESLTLVALGVALGLLAAAFSARVLQASLYGLSSIDPLTYAATALLLLAVALAASSVPALRASRIDPARALRDG